MALSAHSCICWCWSVSNWPEQPNTYCMSPLYPLCSCVPYAFLMCLLWDGLWYLCMLVAAWSILTLFKATARIIVHPSEYPVNGRAGGCDIIRGKQKAKQNIQLTIFIYYVGIKDLAQGYAPLDPDDKSMCRFEFIVSDHGEFVSLFFVKNLAYKHRQYHSSLLPSSLINLCNVQMESWFLMFPSTFGTSCQAWTLT